MSVIDRPEALAAFCRAAESAPYITVDTEFIRDRTYWPKLCLIQIAAGDQAVAVDPLSNGMDLAPFFALMRNPSVLKVFHAGRQDLEIFYNLSGELPDPVFDTQIAAMVCGFGESVGYDRLVETLIGERIDKASQFTDWTRRPLQEKQLTYALADVTHLARVYELLDAKLLETGRRHWLADELAVLLNPDIYAARPEDAWRRQKIRSRNKKYRGVLKEVAIWRESEAQRRNIPRNHVLRDEAIQELASERPTNADMLGRLRAVPKGLANNKWTSALMDAIARGCALPEAELPPFPTNDRRSTSGMPIVELLKVLLKAKCDQHDVAPKLLATSQEIERLAAGDDKDIRALTGWRREVFGEDALRLCRGELGLAVKQDQLCFIPLSSD